MKAWHCLGSGLLFLLGVIVLAACVAIPTILLVGERFTVAGLLDHAQGVRLVSAGSDDAAAGDGKTLELPDSAFSKVLEAFPYALDVGIPRVTDDSRFRPDHEIIITDHRGDETDIRVSVATSHLEIGDGPVLRTPFVWRWALPHFFAQAGRTGAGR